MEPTLQDIQKAIVEANKELDSIEQDKERLHLDCERLSAEKIQSMNDIKKYNIMRDDYKNKMQDAQKEYADKEKNIDILDNKLADLTAKAKHVSNNADEKTVQANNLIQDSNLQKIALDNERAKLKKERSDFENAKRQTVSKEFDYQSAYKNIQDIQSKCDKRNSDLEKERIELSAMRSELEGYIEQNKKAIADLNFERKDSELKKSNYVDSMGHLKQTRQDLQNKITDNEKQSKILTQKLLQAEEHIRTTRRNLEDIKNRENELKVKQLRFEKVLKDKNMLQELKEYEDSLKSP